VHYHHAIVTLVLSVTALLQAGPMHGGTIAEFILLNLCLRQKNQAASGAVNQAWLEELMRS